MELRVFQVPYTALMLSMLGGSLAQLRYSVPEEMEHGAFVGNLAEDLGLRPSELSERKFRLVSGTRRRYLEVNMENGVLFVNERVDREQLCEQSPLCFLHLQAVLENPLELHRVELEVLDVNDNAPSFPRAGFSLDISESATPGSRFPLESAQDADVGENALRSYLLSVNAHFALDVRASKFAELVLQRPLDREQQGAHHMVITAVDGGSPERSGSAHLNVTVVDANDNAPAFERETYRAKVMENAHRGTVVIRLNATDPDEGLNGEVMYSFSGHAPAKVRELFSVDPRTGEVRVRGLVDYEKATMHEIYVQAKDKGPNAIAVHCKVLVTVVDVNDNRPEVILTSTSAPVQEDALPGTVIAVISVMDQDSGENGHVDCEIPHHVPFQLHSSFKNYYTLVTSDFLDREKVPEYNITLTARDMGSPPLFTRKTIVVQVADVNDNAPVFKQPSYNVYLTENNPPGFSVFTISAQDADAGQNSYLSYSVLETDIKGAPASTYVSINSDNGNIYALRSFDREQLKSFQLVIQAKDAGLPPQVSNMTLNVFVLDQNDNAPVIVSPLPENGTAANEIIPTSADAGHLVAKVTATDVDEGQNAKLLYQMLQATDPTLVSIALFTGEVRMIRSLRDGDPTTHRLLILVKDSGEPSLSATASIILSVVDSEPEFSDLPKRPGDHALYLIVSLGAVSFTFLVAIIVLAAIKGYRRRLSKYDNSCCGFSPKASTTEDMKSNLNVRISPVPNGAADTMDVNSGAQLGQNYCYKMCLTPESSKSDFMFLKPYSPTGSALHINNSRTVENNTSTWSPEIQRLNANYTNASLREFKQANKDWTLLKNQQNFAHKSSATVVKTLQRRVILDHSDMCACPGATQYWTWGSHMWDYKTSSEVGGLTDRCWTPRFDYQHNVYIPGTPSSFRPASHGDLDIYNSFSTFGKKKKLTANHDQHEDTIITNDLFK
ncbi:protocadherin-10 isoform X2 [Astyanax mexicanus]|uniref:protocadherin-10 isoform X2 n=1 Tax=Astyanax mexicanus TaxID=7994 RepID=UPI0020CAC35F|nr:protocadherin-10 isoform X2 [Astyanax mexicanus]